ncbi:MAG: anthranilate synthase component I [Xenococcaceae cyanobacterium MO_234.B1]|nr:anthranilate synthase component I [Xenococcaceae cyanobacterium MO_234.B1]
MTSITLPFPWYWRSLTLNNRTGTEIFEKLYSQEPIATLLESPFPTPTDYPHLSRYSICGGAPRRVKGKPQLWTPPLGKVLPFLRSLFAETTISNPEVSHLPFTGGWLGWLSYDVAWEIENLPQINPDPLPFPVAYWYQPETFAVLDHQQQILWLAATFPQQLDILETRLNTPLSSLSSLSSLSPLSPLSPITYQTPQEDYETAVRKAKKHIQAGDIFQANLSLRFHTDTNADSWSIYKTLHQINPSPFASYWRSPWGAMISCSPERLVSLQGNIAQTRPIAGTRRRGITSQQDQQLAAELLANTKERAEHIMLVDLERNDLGKVCQWGSVAVDELLVIERYSHVMHLVSNVVGTLKPECNSIDLIQGMFPGGTITGCPKVRCMEIIEELEPVKRSLFYGSCGYLDWRGNLDLNILIRTLLYTSYEAKNTVYGQVGAGIVADSDPEREWYESLNKAEAQLTALKLV